VSSERGSEPEDAFGEGVEYDGLALIEGIADPEIIGTACEEDRVDVPEQEYRRIEQAIHSDDSPVGIDAKKTHVIILHKLEQIEARLRRLEKALTSY
jgi:hypothetical protein